MNRESVKKEKVNAKRKEEEKEKEERKGTIEQKRRKNTCRGQEPGYISHE